MRGAFPTRRCTRDEGVVGREAESGQVLASSLTRGEATDKDAEGGESRRLPAPGSRLFTMSSAPYSCSDAPEAPPIHAARRVEPPTGVPPPRRMSLSCVRVPGAAVFRRPLTRSTTNFPALGWRNIAPRKANPRGWQRLIRATVFVRRLTNRRSDSVAAAIVTGHREGVRPQQSRSEQAVQRKRPGRR